MVNEYRRPEVVPFSSGGKSADSPALMRGASHIDFIVVEIPDPAKPGQKIKHLELDI